MAKPKPLKLKAEDAEDLKIISAALQDAIGRLGDFRYDRTERHFTAEFNRFQWEAAEQGRKQRVRSAVRFHDVMDTKARNLKRNAAEAVVELLAIEFEPGEAPGGALRLIFSGGGEMRLEVECIDALLADVSAPWPTRRAPEHADD